MSTKIVPTFLLKGINPDKSLIDYQNGVFSELPDRKIKIKVLTNTNMLAPIYGADNSSQIFCLKDKNNCNVIRTTTGYNDYEIFNKNGGQLATGGRCEHCKEDFDTIAIGYPLNYEEKLILTSEITHNYRIIHVFWVEGKFCSFECALGYLRLILSKPCDYRDSIIRDSEYLLKFLYKLMYPLSSILRPSQDPRLLLTNGGSLTKEQWNDQKHIYIRTDKILIMPVKVEYLQQKINNIVEH